MASSERRRGQCVKRHRERASEIARVGGWSSKRGRELIPHITPNGLLVSKDMLLASSIIASGDFREPSSTTSVNGKLIAPGTCPDGSSALGSGSTPSNLRSRMREKRLPEDTKEGEGERTFLSVSHLVVAMIWFPKFF